MQARVNDAEHVHRLAAIGELTASILHQIARRIVEEAGGQITFDSMPGLGSLVRVVLPPLRDE
jgi:hypothetical protein